MAQVIAVSLGRSKREPQALPCRPLSHSQASASSQLPSTTGCSGSSGAFPVRSVMFYTPVSLPPFLWCAPQPATLRSHSGRSVCLSLFLLSFFGVCVLWMEPRALCMLHTLLLSHIPSPVTLLYESQSQWLTHRWRSRPRETIMNVLS